MTCEKNVDPSQLLGEGSGRQKLALLNISRVPVWLPTGKGEGRARKLFLTYLKEHVLFS